MVRLGIVLIVASLVAFPLALLATVFGLIRVASVASSLYVLSPLLLVAGIVLVVLGTRRRQLGRRD
jgi:hypothetical protein